MAATAGSGERPFEALRPSLHWRILLGRCLAVLWTYSFPSTYLHASSDWSRTLKLHKRCWLCIGYTVSPFPLFS